MRMLMSMAKLLKPLSFALLLAAPSAHAFTLQSAGLRGWEASILPIKLNPAKCGLAEPEMAALIEEAIALWNSIPSSSLRLEYGGASSSVASDFAAASPSLIPDSPVILCSDDFAVESGLTGVGAGDISLIHDTVPALVQTGTVASSLVYAPMILNATTNGQASTLALTRNQLKIILAHEIGHMLGLGHASQSSALMYYNVTAKTALALSSDDIAGIAYLYPRNEPFAGEFWGCGTLRNVGGPMSGGGGGFAITALLVFAARWLSGLRLRRGYDRRPLPSTAPCQPS